MSRAARTRSFLHLVCAVAIAGTSVVTQGCGFEAGADYPGGYYGDYPPDWFIATTEPEYFDGRAAYWYGGRWFYRDGGRWGHYDREPHGLYQRRMMGAQRRHMYEGGGHSMGRGGGGRGGGGRGGGGHR
jgi:hypothetical protein